MEKNILNLYSRSYSLPNIKISSKNPIYRIKSLDDINIIKKVNEIEVIKNRCKKKFN